MINCEIQLYFPWSINCVIFEISRTPEVTISPPYPGRVVTEKTEATFKIKSSKLYIPVVTLSINDNIKFLEHLKQGFKRTIS